MSVSHVYRAVYVVTDKSYKFNVCQRSSFALGVLVYVLNISLL